MIKTLTIRMPATLVRELKAKANLARTNPSEILRQAAGDYVRTFKPGVNPILARAGTWEGDVSGVELLRRTRP